jgi:hypothetical protein
MEIILATEVSARPTADEIAGMHWWNSMTETERT